MESAAPDASCLAASLRLVVGRKSISGKDLMASIATGLVATSGKMIFMG